MAPTKTKKPATARKKRTAGGRPAGVVAKRPKEPDVLTAAQDRRYSIMRRTGVDQKTIAESLQARGIDISRQSVGGVIRNRFYNEDVIREFCRLTDTTREQVWRDVPVRAPARVPARG